MKIFGLDIEAKALGTPVDAGEASSGAFSGSMGGGALTTYRSGWTADRAVREGYSQVIWVWRAVNAIAGHAAALPMIQRQSNAVTGEMVETQDNLFALLNRRANVHETGHDFRKRCVAQSMLNPAGVFIEILRDRVGRPVAFELFPMGRMTAVPGVDSFVDHYVLAKGDGDVKIPEYWPDGTLRVGWFRNPHPSDSYRSDTPIEATGLSINLDHMARLYNKSFLENDGRPGGILNVKGDLDEDEEEELRRRFSGGPQVAGSTTVVNVEDIDYRDTSMSPRDAQYVQTRRDTKEDILLAFGTPESVLGNASGRTFANADAELEIFWMETMRPVLTAWDAFWDVISEGSEDDLLWTQHDTSGVPALRRPAESLETRHQQGLVRGAHSLNSYRMALGQEEIDHPLARTHVVAGTYIPGDPDDEDWLIEHGYITSKEAEAPPRGPAGPSDNPDDIPGQRDENPLTLSAESWTELEEKFLEGDEGSLIGLFEI